MRGYLSLDPDAPTLANLVAAQNRLQDALSRQGVHFSDRLAPTLLAWPFGRPEELEETAELLANLPPPTQLALESLQGRPNDDRPAEVGLLLAGTQPLQDQLFTLLKTALDPDPPKPAFIRLVRISPASRKVGAALRGSGLLGLTLPPFTAASITLWRQSPQGFEPYRTMKLADG